jgi:hypothetical protein
MKIIIKEANLDKLTAAIKAAEGRATARTITAKDIISAAEKVTRHLSIPKKTMIGVTADVDINAQDFPSAYKYTPESTQFSMVYCASGWAMDGICRGITRRANRAVDIQLTEAAKEAVLINATMMNTCEI